MRNLTLLFLFFTAGLSAQVSTRYLSPEFDTVSVEYPPPGNAYLHRATIVDTSREGYHPGMVGNLLLFVGAVEEARRALEAGEPAPLRDTARYAHFRDHYRSTPALPQLLRAAEDHEIVIVNEVHHDPRHRTFTRSLLAGLYDRGYRHLGLEALTNWAGADSSLAAHAYPTVRAGFYLQEPEFAAMVQEARDLGFRVFAYEDPYVPGREPAQREAGQTANIVAYRKEHPEGKLLLHAGYDHAAEGTIGGNWGRAMAQRLADSTGLDPLTIDQTAYRERADTSQEESAYRYADPEEPVVYIDARGEPWQYGYDAHWFDYHVFHPRTTYRHGRPDYRFGSGRRAVYLDCADIGGAGPYLLQAYRPGDDLGRTVPRDIVETSPGDPRALVLSAGTYRVLATTPDQRQWVATVTVE
ncbi:hypothetical protein [Lewinella sp. IMCC34183]|uniref:hypothetical protein n=1 Tax=Lewinella sp. IMCC34183 TaxID=2248762 RepID=UPI000E264F9F|nr:hypothetical protein [Lewinella sp. IMCC34183]